MHKLKNILLVDDDEITNFINSDLIRSLDITEQINIAHNGAEAIDYLEKCQVSQEFVSKNGATYCMPDLILLDINMPIMNGFQFLEKYSYMTLDTTVTSVITMLTTSLIKEEVSKALDMSRIVNAYIEKPLTKEIMMEIFGSHLKRTKFL